MYSLNSESHETLTEESTCSIIEYNIKCCDDDKWDEKKDRKNRCHHKGNNAKMKNIVELD